MTFEYTCDHCGTLFIKDRQAAGKHTFCTVSCYRAYLHVHGSWNKNQLTKFCLVCGTEFSVPQNASHHKYCSRDCFHVVHTEYMKANPSNGQPQVERICNYCGKAFMIHAYRIAHGEGQFCSHKCSSAHKRTIRGEDHPLYTSIEKTCEWCGESFLCKPSQFHNRHFCSRQCQGSVTTHNQARQATSIEQTIADLLTSLGIQFETQGKVGRYLCDFVLCEYKVIIECDGVYWHSLPRPRASDKRKNRYIATKTDYRLLRLPGDLIRTDLDACREQILSILKN